MPDPAVVLARAQDRAREQYGSAIGRRRADLVTPALVLDLDAGQRNIDKMAGELASLGATIRPHYKTHKSIELARRQLQAGAGGLSMATVWEAAVLAAAGMDDLFVVNTVAHPDKIATLAGLARDHRILVAVDEVENAAAHSAAAVAAGSVLGVLVEVDTGMDRCGVDTKQDKTYPSIGVYVDYNWLLGKNNRFYVGTGVGAKRILGDRDEFDDAPFVYGTARFLIGVAF